MPGLDELELIEPFDRSEWRAWLKQNADTAASVWLAIGKKGGTVTTLTYDEALDEALCFGWIDSTVRKLDEQRYKQLFSRRKPRSSWSRSNKERVARLAADGKMTPAGRAAIELAIANGSWNTFDRVEDGLVPDDLATALAGNPVALENFESLTEAQRRMYLRWIADVKSPAKRAGRIAEVVRRCAKGRRLTDP